MPPTLVYLWIPWAACLVLAGIHAYLGIHVLERGVIFVDLALAQIAAVGSGVALLAGHQLGSPPAYFLSLGFTVLGAAILSATRSRAGRVPHEAVIGLVFACASATTILLISEARDPHGAEHVQELLAGSILYATGADVIKTAVIYAAIGAMHFAMRRPFGEISRDVGAARAAGRRVALWDFLFYASFGVVITSSVQIAGVLLLFTFLIAPAILGRLVANRFGTRLAVGWSIAAAVSFFGLLASWDRPSGPTIVTLFGLLLAVVGVAAWIRSQARPARAALVVVAVAGCLVALLVGASALFPTDHAHAAESEAIGLPAEPAPDPLAELGAAKLLDDEMLLSALEDASSEADRLRYATVLHRRGEARGTAVLRALARSAESTAVRNAARERSEK